MYDPDSKRIKGREKLIAYRKALQAGKKPDEVPMGEGPLNRDGNPKNPPGQRIVTNWPVLDLGVQPEIDTADWSLTVSGLVKTEKTFSWEEFMALPQIEDVSDFHCVTNWSRLDNRWRGVRFKDIAEQCGVLPEAQFGDGRKME